MIDALMLILVLLGAICFIGVLLAAASVKERCEEEAEKGYLCATNDELRVYNDPDPDKATKCIKITAASVYIWEGPAGGAQTGEYKPLESLIVSAPSGARRVIK